jgi:hypothetical protein
VVVADVSLLPLTLPMHVVVANDPLLAFDFASFSTVIKEGRKGTFF